MDSQRLIRPAAARMTPSREFSRWKTAYRQPVQEAQGLEKAEAGHPRDDAQALFSARSLP
jgi:hypothetical protein